MKKYGSFLLFLSLVSAPSYSQILDFGESDTKRTVINTIKENWFVSTAGGINIYEGDNSRIEESVSDRIAGIGKLSVGKWITSGFALRLSYSAFNMNRGGIQNVALQENNKTYPKDNGNYGNFNGDVMLNLSNMIFGYNFKRVYSFIPYAGVGLLDSWNNSSSTDMTTNLGILNRIRVNHNFDINVDLNSSIILSNFNGDKSGLGKYNSLYGVNIGVTYNISAKKQNTVRELKRRNNFVVSNQKAVKKRICNDIDEAYKQEIYYNEILENVYTDISTNIDAIVERYEADRGINSDKAYVFFELGKSSFENKYNLLLKNIANIINQSSESPSFVITGYADKDTGNSEINYLLSFDRANTVKNCLVNDYNVDEKKIRIEARGGVDDMFFKRNELSRVVIIEKEK